MLRMRDIPRSLLIGENFWGIRFVRKIPGHRTKVLGLCDPADHIIYIRLRQSPKERLITVIHEILHAIEYEAGRDVKHADVDLFGEGLAQVFLDNAG